MLMDSQMLLALRDYERLRQRKLRIILDNAQVRFGRDVLLIPLWMSSGLVILLYEQGGPRRCWKEWEGTPVGRISAA